MSWPPWGNLREKPRMSVRCSVCYGVSGFARKGKLLTCNDCGAKFGIKRLSGPTIEKPLTGFKERK